MLLTKIKLEIAITSLKGLFRSLLPKSGIIPEYFIQNLGIGNPK